MTSEQQYYYTSCGVELYNEVNQYGIYEGETKSYNGGYCRDRDRQKLSNSLILTSGLQGENEWNMQLALQTSFFTLTILSV